MQAIPQHTNIENTPFLQGIEIITVAKEALFYANVFQHRISAPLSKANVCFPLFPSARNPSPAPAQQCVHCSLPQHTECLTWLMLTPSIFLHSPRQTHSPLCPSSSAPFPNNTNLGLREEAKKEGRQLWNAERQLNVISSSQDASTDSVVKHTISFTLSQSISVFVTLCQFIRELSQPLKDLKSLIILQEKTFPHWITTGESLGTEHTQQQLLKEICILQTLKSSRSIN